jgi:RNA polymerase sigma factor (sigma-70 family)
MPLLRRPAVNVKEKLRRLADEELMGLVARNDADAFEVVLERHSDAAFSLAYRICGRRSIAEDVAQEAFLAVWRSATRYDRTRGSVRTWALGIVHNRAIDALRRSGAHDRRRASDEGIEETLEAPERTDTQAIENAAAQEIRERCSSGSSPTSADSRMSRSRRCSTRRWAPSRGACDSACRSSVRNFREGRR